MQKKALFSGLELTLMAGAVSLVAALFYAYQFFVLNVNSLEYLFTQSSHNLSDGQWIVLIIAFGGVFMLANTMLTYFVVGKRA